MIITRGRHFYDTTLGIDILLRGCNYDGIGWHGWQNVSAAQHTSNLAQIASFGYNVIRLPISWEHIEPTQGSYDDTTYIPEVDDIITAATAAGVYVFLDFHQYAWWWSSSNTSGNGAPQWLVSQYSDNRQACINDFFNNVGGLMDIYCAMAAHVADRYKNNYTVIGYDLMNEPPWQGTGAVKLKTFYTAVTDAIRTAEGHSNHMMFVEGEGGWGTGDCVPDRDHVAWANHGYWKVYGTETAYDPTSTDLTPHGPLIDGNGLSLEEYIRSHGYQAFAQDIPYLYGEWGIMYPKTGWADANIAYWVQDHCDIMDDLLISWTWWQYPLNYQTWGDEGMALISKTQVKRAIFFNNGIDTPRLTVTGEEVPPPPPTPPPTPPTPAPSWQTPSSTAGGRRYAPLDPMDHGRIVSIEMTPPTPSDLSGFRHYLSLKRGGPGQEDSTLICQKRADDTYLWSRLPDIQTVYSPALDLDGGAQTHVCMHNETRNAKILKTYLLYLEATASAASDVVVQLGRPNSSNFYFTTTTENDVVGSTPDTTNLTYAVGFSYQRKNFYANGRYWLFWCDGANIVYRTSTDGAAWAASANIRACTEGRKFSVWFDGTHFHYVYASEIANEAMVYRQGTPNADGSIAWVDAEQTVQAADPGKQYFYPFIATDSNDYPWVGYALTEGGDTEPNLIVSSTNDGTWTTGSGFPTSLKAASYAGWRVSIVPLLEGKLCIVYVRNNAIYARLWLGALQAEEEVSTATLVSSIYHTAVAVQNDVYVGFLQDTSNDIHYHKRTYGTGWGSEATVIAATTATSAPVFTVKENLNILCFWASAATDHIYYREWDHAAWSGTTDWIDESGAGGLTAADMFCGYYQEFTDKICIAYERTAGAPYDLRHDEANVGSQWYTKDVTASLSNTVIPKGNPLIAYTIGDGGAAGEVVIVTEYVLTE